MKIAFKRILGVFLALNFLLAMLPAFFALPVSAAAEAGQMPQAAINSFVVKFKNSDSAAFLKNDPGVAEISPVFQQSANPQFKNIYKLKTSYSQAALLQLYGSQIIYLNADAPVRIADVMTNDPGFGGDPGNVDRQWGLFKAGFPAAWAKTTGASNITVAVIDTGIDGTHEDLSAGQVVGGFNFLTNTPIVPGVDSDDNGHGTLVSGIIGASTNNFRGIAGAAWNVRLMPLKALDSNGKGSSSDIAAAINYAADHGADVINLSVGNDFSNGGVVANDITLSNAISYAFQKNVVIVASAGNDVAVTGGDLDIKPTFPICDDNGQNMVIGVAATDISDQKAQFSNFGRACVDVSAPGKHILSTINFDPVTHVRSVDAYAYASGTSVAAPFVSAEAVLIKSVYPNATNQEVRDRIINSADPIDANNLTQCDGSSCAGLIGKGRINAFAALDPNLAIILSEGTIAQADDSAQVYFISGGQKHPVSQFVLRQRFGTVPTRIVPAYVLDSIPTGTYALPNDGTLVKTAQNPTVYEILSGLKRPVTLQVWQQRGFQPGEVNILSDQEISSWVNGTFLPPTDGTLVRARNAPTVYWVIDGLLHPINRGFFIRRGLDSLPIMLLNGNDLKGYALGNAFIY